MSIGASAIDKQRLGRAADSGAAHLGVQHELFRGVEIGGGMHEDMHETFKMRENGHARFMLDARDEALAAARHDDVNRAIEAGKHGTDRGAIARRHERDGGDRQAGLAQSFREAGMNRAHRAETVGATAQDGGIAGFETERAGVRRNVRTALEDHADRAKRRRDPLDPEAVRPLKPLQHAPDRIAQFRDLLDAARHSLDAGGVERQPVEE